MKSEGLKDKVILYDNETQCCGCEACMNICPKSAISMQENSLGCTYPQIDREKCIECGLCKKVCHYQNKEMNTSLNESYASMSKDDELLRKSASGGIFATIAKNILKDGGSVFGCSMENEDGKVIPKHIEIENVKELQKLQGSKYVQSSIGFSYKLIKEKLDEGKNVLFSGTPCQVDGLKGFLGDKEYKNLYTIDIICHGVPGQKMFSDYLKFLEKKLKGKIIGFNFRDKTIGFGFNAKVVYQKKNGEVKEKIIKSHMSSYYSLFLESEIYRENCYTCKYAGKDRAGDITIGDYWGVEKEHPEYVVENGGSLSVDKGVSCILVNNEQGKNLMETYGEGLIINESTFENASRWNRQLNQPSRHSDKREKVFKIYQEKGYKGVDKFFIKSVGVRYYVRRIKSVVKSFRGGFCAK